MRLHCIYDVINSECPVDLAAVLKLATMSNLVPKILHMIFWKPVVALCIICDELLGYLSI